MSKAPSPDPTTDVSTTETTDAATAETTHAAPVSPDRRRATNPEFVGGAEPFRDPTAYLKDVSDDE